MGFLVNRRPQITLAVSRNLETQVEKGGGNDNEVTNGHGRANHTRRASLRG
jgi:hypothetical protein